MTRKIEFTPEMVERILSELSRLHSSDESGTTRLDDEIRALLEAPVEVRELTWVELVNAVSEVRGSEFTPDPDFYIGHQMTGINFNSLRRIVTKFQEQSERSIESVKANSKQLAELDDSTIAKLGGQLKASVQRNAELVYLLGEVSGKLPLLSDKALWARISAVINPVETKPGQAVEREAQMSDEVVGVPRRLLEYILSYEWRGELASSNAMFLRGIIAGRITGYEIQPPAPVAAVLPEHAIEPSLWCVRVPDEPENPEDSSAEYFYPASRSELNRLLKNPGATVVNRYFGEHPAPVAVVSDATHTESGACE